MGDDLSASGVIASAPADSAASPAAPPPATGSDTPAQAIQGQPASGLTTDSATTSSVPGPVPYERFTEVNQRMKQAEERWQKVESSFGDVLREDPQNLRGMLQWYRQAGADPVKFATELIDNLVTNEQYRPQVASQAARILSSLRGVKPADDPEPQPDLVAENGAPVYSATQLRAWREWNAKSDQRNLEARLEKALAPVRKLEEAQRAFAVNQKVSAESAKMYQQAQAWHGFKEHEAEIAKVFNANPNWDLKDAYLHVLHNTILPTLPAQAQAKVVADLQSKAAAQSLNPAGAAKPSTPDFKGDFKAALEHFAGKR